MGERWQVWVASIALFGALGVVPATEARAATPATFSAHGSVEQVYVTHAVAGRPIELRDASGTVVQHAVVDDLGSMLFRDVAPGDGYTVVAGTQGSSPLHVMSRSETPPQSFYDAQHLSPGFGYITTRDGTRLSAEITLPGPADKGPYPTVIEYSGYDPSHPGAPQPSTLIAQLLGYATVGVNVRGSGCSGGTFSFFETLQKLDGYDVVEAVAAQPWVLHGKPGMVGISYPGIAQTFVAPTRPPHLAAIAPLSVVADTYRSLADPGGIPNTGFPREWAQQRDDAAKPYGQGWEQAVVDAGGANGRQCAENQLLRRQNTGLVSLFDSHPFRDPVDLSNELSPQLLDANIDVPVFMGGAWQDEQTGGQSSLIWKNLTRSDGKVKLFATNGTHVDSLVAELNRWYEFLEFYVARRIPHVPAGIRALAPRSSKPRPASAAYSSNLTASRSSPITTPRSPPTRPSRPYGCSSKTAPATRTTSVPRSAHTRCTSRAGPRPTRYLPRGTSSRTRSCHSFRRPCTSATREEPRRTCTTRPRSRGPTSTAALRIYGPRTLPSTGAHCRSARRSHSTASPSRRPL
jgi:hypothetical protein